jgi:mono/diheme cytochrome c family protein
MTEMRVEKEHATMATRAIVGGILGVLVAMGLMTATFAAGPPAPQAADTSDAAAGQQLYTQYCGACHGPDAKGGVKLGDATSADLRWQALGPTYHNDPALVQRAILQGQDQDGQALDDVMPRWQGKLTATQVQDIVAYLQTLTTAVPGQIVATPVHEDVTPQPTEEAQEASQASSVIAQARATAAQATTSEVTAPATSAATAAATTAPGVPATGGGGTSIGGIVLIALGVVGLAAGVVFGAVRRRV